MSLKWDARFLDLQNISQTVEGPFYQGRQVVAKKIEKFVQPDSMDF